MIDTQETMSAPTKQIDTKTNKLSPEGLTDFINTLTLTEVDKAQN